MSPDPNPMPVFHPFNHPAQWSRVIMYVVGGAAALTVSISILFLVIENRRLREASECRFDLSQDVNEQRDQISVSVARIVEAAVLVDEPTTPPAEKERLTRLIPHEAASIRERIEPLEDALEARADAVRTCDG